MKIRDREGEQMKSRAWDFILSVVLYVNYKRVPYEAFVLQHCYRMLKVEHL